METQLLLSKVSYASEIIQFCDPSLRAQFNSHSRLAVVSTFGLPQKLAFNTAFEATLSPSPDMRSRSRWIKLLEKLEKIKEPIPAAARAFLSRTSHLGRSPNLDSMLSTLTALTPEATSLWRKTLLKERCRELVKLRAGVIAPKFRIVSGTRIINVCACSEPLS